MHREILAERVLPAGDIHEHADPAAVDVRRDPARGDLAREAANRQVLADLLHERRAARLDGFAGGERTRAERGDDRAGLSRAIDLRDFGRERAEIVVLGDEVGLAVHLDHRRRLRVGRDVEADRRLPRRCGRRPSTPWRRS